jgi:hypothetical protein
MSGKGRLRQNTLLDRIVRGVSAAVSTSSTAETSNTGPALIADLVPNVSEEPRAGVFLNATIVCVDEDVDSVELMAEGAGSELCQKVRTHPETCRIPIILHTASARVQRRPWGIVCAQSPPIRGHSWRRSARF